MATFDICSTYYATTMSRVGLPIKDWDEINDWYVKWDTLHYSLKSNPDAWEEVTLDSDTTDVVDWKRPVSVEVSAIDENGEITEIVDLDED